jgi:hypothetical protein
MVDNLFKYAQVFIPGIVILAWLVLLILQSLGYTSVPDTLTSAAYACLGLFTGFAVERARTQVK